MSKKIEKTFSANGLTIKLELEGRVDEEVGKFYKALVHQINLSMQNVMNRVATEKMSNQSQKQPEVSEEYLKRTDYTDYPYGDRWTSITEDKPEKQENWNTEVIRRELKMIVYKYDQEKRGGDGLAYVDVNIIDLFVDFIEQLLSERTLEAKIQQLKEDIEQVEMFVPKVVSDTEKYWIPTQILLELEDDLSKLLKESNEDNPNRIKKLQQEK